MSQIQPIGVDLGDQTVPAPLGLPSAATRQRRRIALPLWLRLLLENPKSRAGLMILGFMVLVAIFAPLIATHDPNSFSLFDARQAPSWHHPFGTTDQGTDIFSQVVLGTRTSLLIGAAAALLATVLAATLGILAAYTGGLIDEVITLAR